MYQVNDVVCYQNYGLCRIKEIKKISVMNQKPRPYYLMEKVYDQCDSTLIKIPVDTANFMRPVLTHDEAIALIKRLPDVEVEWYKDVRDREQYYKQQIATWDIDEWAKVIKSIFEFKRLNSAQDKPRPVPQLEIKYFEKAENLFNQELAYALNIEMDQVSDHINHILDK